MNGRYTLTVQYDEPNPHYKEAPLPDYQFGTDRDRRAANEREPRINATVLSCELTPEQFTALKAETLRVWQAELTTPTQITFTKAVK